jgi:hypothetical protein
MRLLCGHFPAAARLLAPAAKRQADASFWPVLKSSPIRSPFSADTSYVMDTRAGDTDASARSGHEEVHMSVCVTDHEVCVLPVQDDLAPWPAEAREMMSRLNDSFPPMMERRRIPRKRYRVEARVALVHAEADAQEMKLYTRDINPWALGFISPHALPAYEHAIIHMPGEDGTILRIKCLIRRCRSFAPGWHQGVIDFEREYPEFGE